MKERITELPSDVRVKMVVFFVLIVIAIAALMSQQEANIRAPVFTMIGLAMILVPLFPTDKLELTQGATLVGTGVALFGAWYWLLDATDGKPGTALVPVTLGTAVLLVIGGIIASVVVAFRNLTTSQKNPDMLRRRKIVRRVRNQLRDLVQRTSSERIVAANGVRYAQHDFDISMLFLNTWPMLANHRQTTYDWEEHENLVENYLVERLEIIARIAVTKHPHQCKYGEIAQSMADEFKTLLQGVNIITVFDPLPATCPECGETKPTHQVNCMAAICWQCKYPTPPSRAGRENTGAVTPQCRIRRICFPRGEQLAASAPVLRRIRLPFTIPQDASDECLSTTQWPRGRRALRDLLKQLQHKEDELLR